MHGSLCKRLQNQDLSIDKTLKVLKKTSDKSETFRMEEANNSILAQIDAKTDFHMYLNQREVHWHN